MFRIAICDDEATSLKLNVALTEKILKEEQIEFEIVTFDNMRKMLETLTKPAQPFDILLSDILTTDMNGIEAAEKIRELGEKLDIIFISTTAAYALDGYRVQALRYLQKPVDIEKLREALLLSYKKNASREKISVTADGKVHNVNFRDIIYVESDARDVHIVLEDKILITHMKISDMEKLLPKEHFFRCHRTYIVNLAAVEHMERYQATMKNGDLVSISQQMYTEMKTKFYKYQG
ncbi:MAG: response regulator transcription factor [Lachnospiraceae bacterium]|nr:response regulator transcription factor [Lachnospiraceae bacterium]MBQ8260707.1 response regulator transcription factor [Lachnospiraceae bacterium]